MRALDSEHIRQGRFGEYFIKMYGTSLEGVLDTLIWAFPDARIVNGPRGNYVIHGEDDVYYGFVVDLSSLEIEVYEWYGLP